MLEITEEELHNNHASYVEKCEKGESFLIVKKDGRKFMMVPASDFEDAKSCVSMDLDEYDYLRDHDDAT
tara:strand:- start:696 stop:902 length:207 start_codon:yes stop_codon:yes gene_type:complete